MVWPFFLGRLKNGDVGLRHPYLEPHRYREEIIVCTDLCAIVFPFVTQFCALIGNYYTRSGTLWA